MKYLKLSFQSARLFRNNKGSKNKHIELIYDDKMGKLVMKKTNRSALGNFEEPIALNHISNVIHCLFGERPVPFFKKVIYKRNDYLYEKAKESFLYIQPHYINKQGEKCFMKETITTSKSDYNSVSTNVTISWQNVKYAMNFNEDILKEMKLYFESLLKEEVSELVPFPEYIRKLRKISDKVDKDFFKTRKLTSIYSYILDEENAYHITKLYNRNKTGQTINRGVETCYVLNGKIIVPITEADEEHLDKYSQGSCNILDGGLVTIDSIVNNLSKRELGDFRKCSELSNEIINKI